MSATNDLTELMNRITEAFGNDRRAFSSLEEIVQHPSGLSRMQRREAQKLIGKTCEAADPTVFWIVEPWYLTIEAYKRFAPCFLIAFLEEDNATAPTKSSLCPESTPRFLNWLFRGAVAERNRQWEHWLTLELIPNCDREMLAALAQYVSYCTDSQQGEACNCYERLWSRYV
ncbi:MAG: hypothetical protein KF784_11520 [Fimbriimonadaceae bacterium]|nr:hypothetical protein [Fimbriimonadaceae bacterium]